jgi:hypothetical protein
VLLRPLSSGGRSVTGYMRDGELMGVVGFNSSSAVLAYADQLTRQQPTTRGTPAETARPRRRLSFQQAVQRENAR